MRWRSAVIPAAVLTIVVLVATVAAATPTRVGSGNSGVAGCSSGAHVASNTSYSADLHGYLISRVAITTDIGCAGMAFRLSLLGADGRQLAEAVGVLRSDGSAATDFTANGIAAADVSAIAVTITARQQPPSVAVTSRQPIGREFRSVAAGDRFA
jgi:hypothetical protein